MFQLEISGVTAKVEVENLQGVEGISQPFEFRIEVSTRSSALAREVGKTAGLTINLRGVRAYRHGVIHRVSFIGAERSQLRYEVLLVPALARLQLRSGCRIFQNSTVPDVISSVLGEHDVDIDKALSETHRTRDCLVQYRETDLEFIERIMGEEGIFYFFKHTRSKSTLVLGDAATSYESLAGRSSVLRYEPELEEKERVSDFSVSNVAGIDSAHLRDYNFETPAANLDVTKKVARTTGVLELYDYPGGYETRAEGQIQVRRRLEAERVGVRSAAAVSNSPRMGPGYTFTLAGHPYRAANAGYVALEVTHYGEIDPGSRSVRYQNDAYCIEATTSYRSTGRYPGVAVQGPQTATVVGPAGEEIHVDEHGRVKVQFHWDTLGQSDENSSAWIRVAQASAGNGWGSFVVPRVGHEVLVDFVDGDPNRPVIVGSLYNGSNTPPYELPDEMTKTVLRTQSTPGGGGSNELQFEDKAGEEQVYLRAQKDLVLVVGNDGNSSVGNDLVQSVGNDLVESVGNDLVESVGNDLTQSVGNNLTVVTGKDFSHTVGSKYVCTIGTNATMTAKTLDFQAADQITLQVGSASLVMKKNGDITIGGKRIEIDASGPLVMKGSNIN